MDERLKDDNSKSLLPWPCRRVTGRARILHIMQLALLALLAMILALILVVDQGARRFAYVSLVLTLALVVLAAVFFNLNGRHKLSAWITMLAMACAPWASIALDPMILKGDIVPLVYIVLSIHLCSTFLNERFTAAIAAVQLVAVILLLIFNPSYASVNWPNFCAYIVCASVIGITTSFITRKHIEEIQAQNEALKISEEQLRILSTRDPLTGQYNRRYMEETLEREISRTLRKNLPLGLMITDLNNFKEINATRGHMAGDAALTHNAGILAESTRKSDVVCRFGGDEFVIIFPECSEETVEARRDLIIEALEKNPFPFSEYTGNVTMSFGIAMLPRDGVTAKELFEAADKALYNAKKRKLQRPAQA